MLEIKAIYIIKKEALQIWSMFYHKIVKNGFSVNALLLITTAPCKSCCVDFILQGGAFLALIHKNANLCRKTNGTHIVSNMNNKY